jgi:hypothetical protein
MQPIKGLNTDTRPLEQPEGTYPFGKNGVQFDLKGASINEEGFKRLGTTAPYTINGIIETDSKPIVFSTDDTNSAIGYFNPVTELYEPIFNDSGLTYKLGFKKDKYVIGQAQRNYKGQIVCAFTDKVTFPKYMNCDNLVVQRLEDWNLFPFYKAPTIKTTIDIGGRLFPGTYYVSTKYQRNDGTTSPYSPVSLGKTVASTTVDGITDKSLTVTITNADPTYDFIIVVIISRIKGVTNAVELDPIPVNANGSTVVVYTGDNLSQAVSLEEILVPPAIYTKVGTMGQLNDALYIADLEKQPDINDMQPYANMCKVEFESQLLNAISPPQEHLDGEIKGFMHDEVYAVYIRYRLKQGGVSKCFTIPGNVKLPAHDAISNEANIGGFVGKVFQVEDTILNVNPATFSGDTGIWENVGEHYPDTPDFDSSALGGLNNRNQLVRHHKMPSMRYCAATFYSNEPEYGRTKLDILGIKVTNIVIPTKYANVIDGYEILYAKRTIANMTNYGQSLLLHGAASRNFAGAASGTFDVHSTGSNWNSWVKTKDKTSYDSSNDLSLRLDTMRFHAFDYILNKPSIKPTYIAAQFKLRRSGLRNGSMLQDGDNGNNSGNTCTIYLVDFTLGPGAVSRTNAGSVCRSVKNGGQLLSNNINVGRFINKACETCFGAQLGGPQWPITVQSNGWYTHNASGSQDEADLYADVVETFLVNLKSIKDTIYLNFYSQTLIAAGAARDLTDSSAFYGGDVYVSDYTFHTYGKHEAGDSWAGFGENATFGKKVIHRFVCESISNIHLRYEIPGNVYSKWYPNTVLNAGDNGAAYPEYYDRNQDPNQFGYVRDLNALNDLLSTSIFSPYREDITDFPYRIHRGGKLSRQTKFRSWRTFLPLDYYECQKNMGYITHLEGMDDKLMIHHENALFMTQDKAKLEGGTLNITLGSGDIFQFEPQEIQSAKLGYAGTQHELACVRTPAGYVFVDAKQGEVYIYKAQQLKNLNIGLNRLLRKYLKITDNNPFVNNGITIGWDQKYKRIMFTIKNTNSETSTSFTLSYSIETASWVFFHDYIPDMYFHTREQLWTLKNQVFYKHNSNLPGLFYDQTPKPFFIDIIFQSDSDLLLESVNWITEIIQGNLDNSDVEVEWKTITHLSIWNSQQHTGKIALKDVFENLQYENSRKTQGTWSFNDLRNILKDRGTQFLMDIFHDYTLIQNEIDTNKAWYDKELLEDKYFTVRFEFDNLSGKQIILHSVNAQALKSDR